MLVNVWLMYKANEPRVYTRTTEPDVEQKAAYRKEGFRVFRAVVDLPVDQDTEEVCAEAQLELQSLDGNVVI